MMIQLIDKHLNLVKDILKVEISTQKIYVFGSRATNKAQKFSDLDLCIEGEKISFEKMLQLKNDFSESDLPYFVDIVQKVNLSEDFYNIIKQEFIELKM